jgi:uncharacterized protein (TIGR00645 family)
MERFFERILVASRWLMMPLYFGLALLLVLFVIEFFAQFARLVMAMASRQNPHLVLTALTLVDIVLVAGLVIMVMIMVSGFSSLVAKIRLGEGDPHLSWLVQLDPTALKVKMVGSIAVISAIYLLEQFLDIGTTAEVANGRLLWMVAIHLVFVVTALLLALLDRITDR